MRAVTTIFVALTALLAALLAAGGSKGESRSEDARVDYFETERGRAGGTLRISVPADTPTLDPHVSLGGHWTGQLLFDSLVYLDDRGSITPWLARSWEVSPDGKTYTFHLRDDVTFSDGAKFNAEAVKINLDRARDPTTKTAVATAYIEPYVGGTVVDEYTFQAHLREPHSPFLNYLATCYLGMVSPRQIRERPQDLSENPIGSGPFVQESYARNQSIHFVKRKDYHWSPPFIRHEGAAYLDRIEAEFVPEAMSRYGSLSSGQFDLTLDAPWQNVAAIRADPDLRFANTTIKGYPVPGIIFNTERRPFDDVRVRKAVALATDREGIAKMVGFGGLKLKTDFLSSNLAYYDPSFQNVLKHDLAGANRLLDEAGWTERDAAGRRVKDGQPLTADVLVSTTSVPRLIIVAIQSNLKKIGLDLQIVNLPGAQMLVRRNAGKYQAIVNTFWFMNTPDILFILFHTRQIITESYIGQNYARLSDPELDRLVTEARHTLDPARLTELYSAAQRRLTEVVPSVPLFENQVKTAYRSHVRGITYDTSHTKPSFTTAWLDR
jgi:peptide/nickel transport system substrate-binding protein